MQFSTMRTVAAAGACASAALGLASAPALAAQTPQSATAPTAAKVAAAAPAATVSKSWCHSMQTGGVYRTTGKAVNYKGKTGLLRTEARWDEQAVGFARDISTGDKVTVWRSAHKYTMKKKPRYLKNPRGRSVGCSRTASWSDANVLDWMWTPAVRLQSHGKSFAVRICLYPHNGGKKCQKKWFVDHK